MREHQQAAGEDDRHHAGLVDPQRQVLPRAAVDPAAADVLGALRGDPPLALRDEHHAGDHADEQHGQHEQRLDAELARRRRPVRADVMSAEQLQPAPGMRARMPAMISRLMPLPMPYSSICSPSHIRKTVPAVMVSTADELPAERAAPPSTRNSSCDQALGDDQQADVEPALAEAEHDGGVAGVFVDLLPAAFALLLQLLQRRLDAAQELEDNRGRDVGHDAQAEDRGLAELAGAEHGHRAGAARPARRSPAD